MIYNALISSYFNYGILVWGYHCNRLSKLQKMSIRHLTKSKYNAHTFPLFKRMNILTISDLFYLSQLKFYYKFVKNDIPKYFKHSFFVTNEAIHGRYTRNRSSVSIPRVRHTFAKILFDTANVYRWLLRQFINTLFKNIYFIWRKIILNLEI